MSGLYEKRGAAFGQPPESGSEVALRMQGISFGENDDHTLMRVHVNDWHAQDFAADRGTPLATVLLAMGEMLARELKTAAPEFRSEKPKKH